MEGVYTLPIEVKFGEKTLSINPVLIELPRGLALIDAGMSNTTDQLTHRIQETGHSIKEIRLLILTHQDGDHAGGGSFVVEQSGATVCTSSLEARPISGETRPRGPEENSYPTVPVDVELLEGTVFRTLAGPMEVIETPGHTPGHFSLFLHNNGTVIAGDALVIHKGQLAGPHPKMSEDMQAARKAIDHIAEYPVRDVLCFHGGYTQTSPAALKELSKSLS